MHNKIKNQFSNNCALLMLHVESGGRLALKMINKLTKIYIYIACRKECYLKYALPLFHHL